MTSTNQNLESLKALVSNPPKCIHNSIVHDAMKREILLNLLTVCRQVRWVLLFLLSFARAIACANHFLQSFLFKWIFSANYLSMDSKTFLSVTSDFCKLSPSLKVKNIFANRPKNELKTTNGRVDIDANCFICTIPEYNSKTSITNFIKNWIIGWWNSTALIGLAIVVYEPLFHALSNMVTVHVCSKLKTVWKSVVSTSNCKFWIFWGRF